MGLKALSRARTVNRSRPPFWNLVHGRGQGVKPLISQHILARHKKFVPGRIFIYATSTREICTTTHSIDLLSTGSGQTCHARRSHAIRGIHPRVYTSILALAQLC
jgi:hypothetical protein